MSTVQVPSELIQKAIDAMTDVAYGAPRFGKPIRGVLTELQLLLDAREDARIDKTQPP